MIKRRHMARNIIRPMCQRKTQMSVAELVFGKMTMVMPIAIVNNLLKFALAGWVRRGLANETPLEARQRGAGGAQAR